MGLYAKYIFPRILDLTAGSREFGEYRRRALEPARGETLEIGFGTGLNLPYYPETVTGLSAIDSENMLEDRVEKRVAACPFSVTRMRLDAQGRLPFEDRTFDTVVTTLTLCSIPDAAAALSEMRRALKPEGRYLFFEHGRSDDPRVARRQDRFNPIQKIIGVGCNLNRRIDELIGNAGFEIMTLDRFLLPHAPRILAEMYRGVARP
jgi:ubiquinone/menaquinone biosynthesis C-methylase UbiE